MSLIPSKTELDLQMLRQALDYDPVTGNFVWLRTRNSTLIGQIAGNRNSEGYIKIGLCRANWLAHRLAWAFVHGSLPPRPMQIDHINRIRHDNRLCNLRVVTHRENVKNSARFDQTLAGTTLTRRGRWQAQIGIAGKNKYLGSFATQNEAHAAYCRASVQSMGGSL